MRKNMFKIKYIDDNNKLHIMRTDDFKYVMFLYERFVVLNILAY